MNDHSPTPQAEVVARLRNRMSSARFMMSIKDFGIAVETNDISFILNALESATAREAELSAAMEDAGRLQKALTKLCQHFPIDDDMKEAGWDIQTIEGACEAYDSARHVLSARVGAVTVKAGEL